MPTPTRPPTPRTPAPPARSASSGDAGAPAEPQPLTTKDLLRIDALSAADIGQILDTAERCRLEPRAFSGALRGRTVILIFEKPSLRTRVSFEVGVERLGGHALYYEHSQERIGSREAVKDYGRNLERWVSCVVGRVYQQRVLEELAQSSSVPVINALSNEHHPCQALADLLTLRQRFGSLAGLRVAFVGDGNNVCVSLMQGVCATGGHMTVIGAEGYQPDRGVIEWCQSAARASGGSLRVTADLAAVAGSDAVYTDAWTSMHQSDGAARASAFARYQVNADVMALAAGPTAGRAGGRRRGGGRAAERGERRGGQRGVDRAAGPVFMHCLPAHRGVEVTDGVIDSPASLVYEQAENRMHAQNAVLLHTVVARDLWSIAERRARP